ncbi:type II secretory pathway, component PulK [Gynuella sunshinyii YC6258]|uniref:Type II secretion system protein K n=1 Tax=Gynuella sunshinyii YC6258 TaxID=1445510 RepID=A0A0C5V928_9GAMM|nr:type II secretory pathway, component PulK [Gynuella sunshinyii YC6258]
MQVLLILTLLSLVATNIQLAQRQSLDRSVSVLMRGQAREYLLGAEKMGAQLLYFDGTVTMPGSKYDNTKFDDLANQLWNGSSTDTDTDTGLIGPVLLGQGRETELEQGMAMVQVTDLNRRFNINWLSDQNPDADLMKSSFSRLLDALGINTALADSVRNWFHQDSGAEYLYTTKEPPYFPPVMPMSDISELRLVDGMTDDFYDKLKDYVCALPVDMRLNVNTASAEVLQTVSSSWTNDNIQKIVDSRKDAPFMSIDEMINTVGFTEDELKGLDEDMLTINSDYFLVHAEVDLEDRLGRLNIPFYIQSVLYRDQNNAVELLSRNLSVTPLDNTAVSETNTQTQVNIN